MINADSIAVLGFFGIGQTELLIMAGILVLLFGGAKLPGLMRNMGRSINEFKAGIKEKPQEVPPKVEEYSETKASIKGKPQEVPPKVEEYSETK